jgi:environmental stress-induced protein Ves
MIAGMIFGMRIIRHDTFTATPWKNGGGITHEALREPAQGDPFRWRVSVAHIAQSGPFSDFAGYQRTMILLKGGGVRLNFVDGDVRTLRTPGASAEFDGGIAAQCELLEGPCVDLNFMVAKSERGVRSWVQRLAANEPYTLPVGRDVLLFALDAGGLDTDVAIHCDESEGSLERWDLAVLPASARAEVSALRSTALFIAVVPAVVSS